MIVDVELVLAADVSSSRDVEERQAQLDGYASAFLDETRDMQQRDGRERVGEPRSCADDCGEISSGGETKAATLHASGRRKRSGSFGRRRTQSQGKARIGSRCPWISPERLAVLGRNFHDRQRNSDIGAPAGRAIALRGLPNGRILPIFGRINHSVGSRLAAGLAEGEAFGSQPSSQELPNRSGAAGQSVAKSEIIDGTKLTDVEHDLQALSAGELSPFCGHLRHSSLPDSK